MLYQFLLNYVDTFGFLNVFKYLTFRTGLSVFTSLIIVLIIGVLIYLNIYGVETTKFNTLIKSEISVDEKNRILKKEVSKKINPILRKIVSTKEGTANFANIDGYEVGGKTGTAQKSINGIYSKNKINTFVAVFPISEPKYILLVLLDEPKPSKDYIYHYRDGSGWKYKGTPYNTAGWTSVEIAGKIIEKIGPILAINKIDFYDNHVVKKSN